MKKKALISTGTTGAQKGARRGLITNPSAGVAKKKGFMKNSIISTGTMGRVKKIKKV